MTEIEIPFLLIPLHARKHGRLRYVRAWSYVWQTRTVIEAT